jgi:broad specificity phosphatase PhoE
MITAFLIRHAERDPVGIDPPLNVKGMARAKDLIRVLGGVTIAKLYATQFRRTQETAAPLATHLGIPVTVKIADDLAAVVADIASQPGGARVLVVGHTNTIGEIIERLTGQTIADIPESAFDNLYICTLAAGSDATVLHLKYGEPT